jgi:predicted GIY-YIG superfamily endonuclease
MDRGEEFCYMLHFSASFSHSRHYIGTTHDVVKRVTRHMKGQSNVGFLNAALASGIHFTLVRVWSGGHDVERKLKDRKDAPRQCPICNRKFHRTVEETELVEKYRRRLRTNENRRLGDQSIQGMRKEVEVQLKKHDAHAPEGA